MYENENLLLEEFKLIAGVDEAGRGPLAGPLVVAACILDPGKVILTLNDSKQIPEDKRDAVYDQVLLAACDYKIVVVPVCEIDRLNILGATMLGMEQAVRGLKKKPDLVLLDGNSKPLGLSGARTVIRGDAQYASIAAASILAKVTRDRIMREIHKDYPHYNFIRNKGYPTREHLTILKERGATVNHRKTYRPVYEMLKLDIYEEIEII